MCRSLRHLAKQSSATGQVADLVGILLCAGNVQEAVCRGALSLGLGDLLQPPGRRRSAKAGGHCMIRPARKQLLEQSTLPETWRTTWTLMMCMAGVIRCASTTCTVTGRFSWPGCTGGVSVNEGVTNLEVLVGRRVREVAALLQLVGLRVDLRVRHHAEELLVTLRSPASEPFMRQ